MRSVTSEAQRWQVPISKSHSMKAEEGGLNRRSLILEPGLCSTPIGWVLSSSQIRDLPHFLPLPKVWLCEHKMEPFSSPCHPWTRRASGERLHSLLSSCQFCTPSLLTHPGASRSTLPAASRTDTCCVTQFVAFLSVNEIFNRAGCLLTGLEQGETREARNWKEPLGGGAVAMGGGSDVVQRG